VGKTRRARAGLWAARALGAISSLAAGLCLAEGAAGAVHHGAYPFLNIFEADADFGVRLRAGASTRTRSRGGTVTAVTTNEQGFRGPSWVLPDGDEPVRGRTLLLGDSQMFGYGVAYERGTAAALSRLSGGEVLDGAVPTWGPTEYPLAIERLAPRYRPEAVVLVLNVANDWFETSTPNTRRTTARDGWAARPQASAASEPAPRWFPGRDFVMGRSHLVLLTRELWAFRGERMAPQAEGALRVGREAPRLAAQHRAGTAPIMRHVREARAACERWRCRLLIAALPLDAQVDAGEWAKYRTAPRRLDGADALIDAFSADLARDGSALIDLRAPLRAASPGAFLPDDYHLSPAGHEAVGRALADALRAARAEPTPGPATGARLAADGPPDATQEFPKETSR
jgi:hypothetical protein